MQKKKSNVFSKPYEKAQLSGEYTVPAETTNTFYNAIVISNDDPLESKRIKVRIDSVDFKVSNEDLPWCISLNPSYLFGIPFPGEMVIVFLQNPWNKQIGRYYMGPIRSGDSADYENFNETKRNLEIKKHGL